MQPWTVEDVDAVALILIHCGRSMIITVIDVPTTCFLGDIVQLLVY